MNLSCLLACFTLEAWERQSSAEWVQSAKALLAGMPSWTLKDGGGLTAELVHYVKRTNRGAGNLDSEEWVHHLHGPQGLPRWLSVKNPPANAGHLGSILVGKIPWRRKWHPTPVFLPGRPHGWGSLVSYGPRGQKRVGHYWATKQEQQPMKLRSGKPGSPSN